MAWLDLQYRRDGLYLPRLDLWLDAHAPINGTGRVFVSHAHADHTARHREVILTAPTAKLMQARLGGRRVEHVLACREPRTFEGSGNPFRLTLLPAGHVLGSAMAWIEAAGETLLYTGDFKLRPGLSAEPCEPRPADTLVMETTFGRPQYRFPPTAAVVSGIVRFCRETIAEGQTAVLLGYSLGKSQELLCRLANAGLPLALHPQVHKLTVVYAACGVEFPPYEQLTPGDAAGKVVICPPQAATKLWLHHLGPSRVAFLSGWAVDSVWRFRAGADAVFPLSDHADFDDLLRLVELVRPRRVLTLHGFAADFARVLRDRGHDARALGEVEQLELRLPSSVQPGLAPDSLTASVAATGTASPGQSSREAPPAPIRPPVQPEVDAGAGLTPAETFAEFAAACAQIASAPAELAKIECLARYLRSVPPNGLALVVVWFGGLPFASIEARRLQVGWAVLRTALCRACGVTEAAFRHEYLRHGDAGETAAALWPPPTDRLPRLPLLDVARLFDALTVVSGPAAKLPLLSRLLAPCGATEARYLVKIITGDLRLGLREGFVERAIALAFQADEAAVRRAIRLCGHPGEVAALARCGELDRATLVPFRPLQPMLASPEPTPGAAWARLQAMQPARAWAWVEDKHDGLRCQLHKVGERVALFTRDARDVTASFPELAEAARKLTGDVILDGEVLAVQGDTPLPFSALQKRLAQREDDLFPGDDVSVAFIAFDFLWGDKQPWLDAPLPERRRQLEARLPVGSLVRLADVTHAASEKEIEAAFRAACERGQTGLMIKDPQSPYTPGQRGFAWLKLRLRAVTLQEGEPRSARNTQQECTSPSSVARVPLTDR